MTPRARFYECKNKPSWV